jgi:hypothetical protein
MAALNELLRIEEEVARRVREGVAEAVAVAPMAPRVPTRYETCVVDQARPRQTRLGWWDRFQVADGLLPGALRFAVAGVLLAGVLLAGQAQH